MTCTPLWACDVLHGARVASAERTQASHQELMRRRFYPRRAGPVARLGNWSGWSDHPGLGEQSERMCVCGSSHFGSSSRIERDGLEGPRSQSFVIGVSFVLFCHGMWQGWQGGEEGSQQQGPRVWWWRQQAWRLHGEGSGQGLHRQHGKTVAVMPRPGHQDGPEGCPAGGQRPAAGQAKCRWDCTYCASTGNWATRDTCRGAVPHSS